jgi:hypothetical protein
LISLRSTPCSREHHDHRSYLGRAGAELGNKPARGDEMFHDAGSPVYLIGKPELTIVISMQPGAARSIG